jgi:prepilin peptidase CpaA
MYSMPLPPWSVALTATLVGVAMVTDLRWRRIPNSLTFPAAAVALGMRAALQGWAGLGLAVAGAVVAPALLLAMHRGRGLGMGDVKLAMALGAVLGPVLGGVAMFASALCGGVMALAVMTVHGKGIAPVLQLLTIGAPFARRTARARDAQSPPLTMPYGVAIGVGSLITLAVCWWTGQDTWFLSFVQIAGSR